MRILLSRTGLKYLAKMDQAARSRIISAIEGLPEKGDIKKIHGWKLSNIFRLRVGKHRILFIWEKDIIRVVDIDTRGDIYK
jgi:mRNA-degrading endonuclease RelE of RelBE toxin-antitoxin system